MSDDVERVRRATDIVELIESFVPLKRAGSSYSALCPFHEERTASFHVFPDRQYFKCFGCNAAGDCFEFVQKRQSLSFREALEFLAERAGVQLTRRPRETAGPDRRTALECLEVATQYFEQLLHRTPALWPALDARGLTAPLRREWRMGLAPAGWQTLHEYLAGKGFGTEIQLAAGIVAKSENGRIYDRFRDRFTFPICDVLGRVVAFGARLLPGVAEGEKNGPKYLNSPENELFKKGSLLYGLDKVARAPRTSPEAQDAPRPIVVMEGYTDVILAHHAGLRRSVATLGTALGRDHAKLIKRFSGEVLLLYDGDEAGLRATERGVGILLEEGLRVRVAVLPDDLDPADYVVQRGPEAFLREVGDGIEFLEFLATRLTSRGRNSMAPEERARVCDEILHYVAKVDSEVQRDLWVRKVASWFALSETRVGERLSKLVAERPRSRGESTASGADASGSALVDGRHASVYGDLLGALLRDGSLFALVRASGFRPEVLGTGGHRAVYEAIAACVEAGEEPDMHAVARRLVDTPYRGLPAALFARAPQDPERAIEKTLQFYAGERAQSQIANLKERLRDAELRGDREAARQLQSELLLAHRGVRRAPDQRVPGAPPAPVAEANSSNAGDCG